VSGQSPASPDARVHQPLGEATPVVVHTGPSMLVYVESTGSGPPCLVVNNGHVSVAVMPESATVSQHDVILAERLFGCAREYLGRVYLARQEQLTAAGCPLRLTDSEEQPRVAGRPLVVTADPELFDELLHLASATGVELDITADPAAARARSAAAPLVLVGRDVAEANCPAGLPQRPDLVLVGGSDSSIEPPGQLAEQLGAARVAILPAAGPWLVDLFAGLVHRPQRDGRPVVTEPTP
jgi:hypothetical protein